MVNATDQAMRAADELWSNYVLPPEVGVNGGSGWTDDGEGELVRTFFLGFDSDQPGADSTRAHFVVPYSTMTGDLTGEGELRITETGAVLGHAEPPAAAPAP